MTLSVCARISRVLRVGGVQLWLQALRCWRSKKRDPLPPLTNTIARHRWCGDGVTAAALLDAPPSSDPLACLEPAVNNHPGAGGTLAALRQLAAGGGCEPGDAGGGLVVTEGARRALALVAPWLQRGEPFLLVSFGFAVWGTRCFCSARRSQTHAHAGSWLNPKTVPGPHNARPDPPHQVGPEGCGKGALLRHAFARLRRGGPLAIAEVHCSAATGAGQIIDKLVQVRTFL